MNSLLTPRKAAEFLGIPEHTLAEWRSQRRGPPYIKLESRLVRYRQSDLENYLSERAVETNLTINLRSVRVSNHEEEGKESPRGHTWSSRGNGSC
jgi:predicted DNA-binding transcriptional regulator AlpA